MITEEIVFASQAHADLAVATIDTNAGFTLPTTWDYPRSFGSIWIIARPDVAGYETGVINVVRYQAMGTAKVSFIEENDDSTVLDNNGSEIEDFNEES